MRRNWARRIGVAAAIVVALIVVAVVAARLWIGSERGRRTVERKLDQAVATHLGGHVRVGHLSGTLVGGVTVDDVEWRDDTGRPALRARRVVARWSAASAIAKRPALELRVEEPIVDVERLVAGVDLDEAMRLVSESKQRLAALTLSPFAIVDATVEVGGLTLRGVDVRGAGVRWDRAAGTVSADRLTVRAGASSATARGRLTRDAIDLRLTALDLAPDDLRRLSPRAEAPRTPLVGEAQLRGPLDRAVVGGELRPDRGRIVFGGTLDLRGRRARVRATLDDVEADYTPAALAGTIRLRAAVAGGKLTLAWRADGHYFRRELDPNLQLPSQRARDFAAVRPGGRFAGSGRLVARVVDRAPVARMRFRLTIADPGQAARLLAGPDLRASPKPLVLDGDWRLAGHAAPTLTLTREP